MEGLQHRTSRANIWPKHDHCSTHIRNDQFPHAVVECGFTIDVNVSRTRGQRWPSVITLTTVGQTGWMFASHPESIKLKILFLMTSSVIFGVNIAGDGVSQLYIPAGCTTQPVHHIQNLHSSLMVASLEVWRFLLIQRREVNPKKKVIQPGTGITMTLACLRALS